MIRKVLGVGAGVGVGGWLYARQTMGQDALERIIEFDRVAIPAIVEYKLEEARCEKLPYQWPFNYIYSEVSQEEQKKRFEKLHIKWAKPVYDIYMKLGGFYYKSGQKIASNTGGVSPKHYVDVFQPFLNDIPARDFKEVVSVVEGELGCKLSEVFSSFEEKPIGCASIGQVHRAVLKSNGQKVVVKVQNPEAERTFVGDVFALKVLVDTFMPQISVAFDEIQKQFATEFDYRGECKNALEIYENLKKEPAFDDIIVPEVYPELCSKRLLVMEEISPSIPLHVVLEKQAEIMAKQQGLTKEEFMELEGKRIEDETVRLAKEGKVVDAVSSDTYERYIKLQKAKRATWTFAKTCYNFTLGWVLTPYDLSEEDTFVPLNAAKLIDDLLHVHGHEVLIDGCFNADPHPGNVLCANGKLALIDYGQVKRMSDEQRLDLAKTILLVDECIKVDPRVNPNVDMKIHEKAKASLVSHARAIGMKTEKNLDDTFYEMNLVYLGRMDRAFIYPRNLLQWTDYMQEKDPVGNIEEVDYLVMVNMSSMMLRGLGEMLQQPRNLAKVWAPLAKKSLKAAGRLQAVEDEIKSWSA